MTADPKWAARGDFADRRPRADFGERTGEFGYGVPPYVVFDPSKVCPGPGAVLLRTARRIFVDKCMSQTIDYATESYAAEHLPVWWRCVLIAVATLILCSCSSPAIRTHSAADKSLVETPSANESAAINL